MALIKDCDGCATFVQTAALSRDAVTRLLFAGTKPSIVLVSVCSVLYICCAIMLWYTFQTPLHICKSEYGK